MSAQVQLVLSHPSKRPKNPHFWAETHTIQKQIGVYTTLYNPLFLPKNGGNFGLVRILEHRAASPRSTVRKWTKPIQRTHKASLAIFCIAAVTHPTVSKDCLASSQMSTSAKLLVIPTTPSHLSCSFLILHRSLQNYNSSSSIFQRLSLS